MTRAKEEGTCSIIVVQCKMPGAAGGRSSRTAELYLSTSRFWHSLFLFLQVSEPRSLLYCHQRALCQPENKVAGACVRHRPRAAFVCDSVFPLTQCSTATSTSSSVSDSQSLTGPHPYSHAASGSVTVSDTDTVTVTVTLAFL